MTNQVQTLISGMQGGGTLYFLSCYCSVAKSCQTLCDPMDCSTRGSPVLHYLPEFAQIHVHWVGDTILPFPCLPLPSLFCPQSFPLGLFQWGSSSHQVAKVLELQLQHQYFQWIFKVDFLQDGLVWSPCCPRNSQESSPALQFESINSLAFSLLYGPTLKSACDYWKNHCFDYMDFYQQSDISAL